MPPLTTSEVTAGTAARILGVSPRTIENMCEEGKLRARRIGERGWWRIDYASVIEVLNASRNPASAATRQN
jgi:excisionase family DNA binding protein